MSLPPVYVHDWSLAPGSYDLRVALQDESGSRIGATQLSVDVSDAPEGWSTSDLMLLVTDGIQEPRPLINGRVMAPDWILTYVEVSGGRRPILAGDILTADGTERLAQLPELPLERDRAGIFRGAHRIKTIPPGRYLLEIVVLDRPANKGGVFRTPLEVVLPGS